MWCDTFDADLLAVVPGAVEALGDTAQLELHTYSSLTDGKINCPASWHTDAGLTAFFSTTDRSPAPPAYHTGKPLVRCTFLEAVRDEWVHGAVVAVNRTVVWSPPNSVIANLVRPAMERLMYDVRGWDVLDDEDRQHARSDVLQSLSDAAYMVRAVTGLGG